MESIIRLICRKIFEVIKDEKITRQDAEDELRSQISNLSDSMHSLDIRITEERSKRIYNDDMIVDSVSRLNAEVENIKLTDERVNAIIDELYNETFNTPQELTLKLVETIVSPGNKKDGFGRSIAVNERGLIVGAHTKPSGDMSSVGTAYAFIRENNAWALNQEIMSGHPKAYDRFGQGAALLNDDLIVGSPSGDMGTTNSGTIYRYQWTNGEFSPIAYAINGRLGVDENSDFGASVAFDDKWLLIGAPQRDGVGCVNLYPSALNNKEFVNAFFGPYNATGARYGEAIHMISDALFIGAPGLNKVFVIPRDTAGNFDSNNTMTFDAPRTDAIDFGSAIVTHNDHIFVSAPKTFVQGNETGTIFVYKRGENPGEVTLVKEIPSPLPRHQILFGAALAVHDSKLYVSTIDTSTVSSAPEQVDVFEISGI